MKRIFAILTLTAVLLSICACAKTDDTIKDADPSQAVSEATDDANTEVNDAFAEDTQKQEENDADAPENQNSNSQVKVYWATKDRDSSDVAYHTKDCELIKDKDPEELSWEIINTLGMPECEKCNPIK